MQDYKDYEGRCKYCGHTELILSESQEQADENVNRDTEIASTTEEAHGLSYGKRKALKFMEENREELWGSLYSEIKKVQ